MNLATHESFTEERFRVFSRHPQNFFPQIMVEYGNMSINLLAPGNFFSVTFLDILTAFSETFMVHGIFYATHISKATYVKIIKCVWAEVWARPV